MIKTHLVARNGHPRQTLCERAHKRIVTVNPTCKTCQRIARMIKEAVTKRRQA